jgi:hypothetical protein
MTEERCVKELYEIALKRPQNAKTLAQLSIGQYNPFRTPAISDRLLLQFRDLPVHNEIATFIFEELARDVLRTH